jgi:hypothetical protein
MWRMFALPGGYSLGAFLADVVELRQHKGRRIYLLGDWVNKGRTNV